VGVGQEGGARREGEDPANDVGVCKRGSSSSTLALAGHLGAKFLEAASKVLDVTASPASPRSVQQVQYAVTQGRCVTQSTWGPRGVKRHWH